MTNAFPTRRSSDRQGVAGGHRSLATAYDQRADRLVPGTGRIGLDCGATEEGCPREPARPVDPDDARGLGRGRAVVGLDRALTRSEEHTSELQPLMRISYAVFVLKKKKNTKK